MHLPDFSAARLLVAGDLMLDRYWSGGAGRLSPEAPVPVVRVEGEEVRPGGAGNVALNAAALGSRVRLLGLTGEDAEARALAEALSAGGVDCAFLRDPGIRTLVKLRVLSRHQQLIRLDFEDDLAAIAATGMEEAFGEELAGADAVVLSDYGKGTLAGVADLIERARAAGKPVLVDPKGSDFRRYRGASVLTPNRAELEAVVGPCETDALLVDKAEGLRAELDLEALLVTRGERGMTLVRAGADAVHVSTRAREVFDVTGAGDTVIATLAAALAGGEEWEPAVALANLAAGVVVARLGTVSVTAGELRRARLADSGEPKVLAEEELVAAVADARAHGERVAVTNGCFDLLHAGHVAYLEEAAGLADRLVVAVNDDASVARLKGRGRPVTPLEQRMAVLQGLAAVDWVVPFTEDTPERLVGRLQPDILVKGGDYRAEDIAGYRSVTEAGGRVVVLPFREGCSSSRIIDAVRDSGSKEEGH